VKARARARRAADPEAARAYDRARYVAHIEAVKARARARYAADPEAERDRARAWNAAHPELRRAAKAARRALLAQCPVGDRKAVAAFYKKVQEAPRIRCYWCRGWVKKGDRDVDHIVPLKPRGNNPKGMHGIGNLCCACVECNRSKSNKPPEEVSGQGELFTG
jgi:5-methylcytosine-specific restriction endonuclease McrA